MKGLIFYFSGTGTTKLAIEYIAANIKNIDFDLHDMADTAIPDLTQYDLFGFATYAQTFSPPLCVENFIHKLKNKNINYAFIFNTYGFINGNTLSNLNKWLNNINCRVIAGFALHTPESSPIMIQYKITSENYPNERELEKFNNFIKRLDQMILKLKSKEAIHELNIKENSLYTLLKNITNNSSLATIGNKLVNPDKCIKCGLCMRICPYEAIDLKNGYPEFHERRCKSCFICYNKCPTQAISSNKHSTIHYNKPNEKVSSKLKIRS